MTYPCSCGTNAISDGRKYLKTERCVKRRYKCVCGKVIHTKEYLAQPGPLGRPRKEPMRYEG